MKMAHVSLWPYETWWCSTEDPKKEPGARNYTIILHVSEMRISTQPLLGGSLAAKGGRFSQNPPYNMGVIADRIDHWEIQIQ